MPESRGNRFTWSYRTNAVGTLTPGVSVIPGTSNADGAYTQIASGGNIAHDVFEVLLQVSDGSTTAQDKSQLLTLGWDPAGSTGYVDKIKQVVCGGSSPINSGLAGAGSRWYRFHCYIPAGSSVGVFLRGVNATPGTVRITATFYGMPTNPDDVQVAQYFETIGTITNSQGQTFTPGNGANGTWAKLGATTKMLWGWQIGVQDSGSALQGRACLVDLSHGTPGGVAADPKTMIIEGLVCTTDSGEALGHPLAPQDYCEVPAGDEIWVRGNCSGTVQGTWNAVAIGQGG